MQQATRRNLSIPKSNSLGHNCEGHNYKGHNYIGNKYDLSISRSNSRGPSAQSSNFVVTLVPHLKQKNMACVFMAYIVMAYIVEAYVATGYVAMAM